MRRFPGLVVAAAVVALVGAPTAAVAEPNPKTPGDLEPTLVAWLDPAGHPVDAVHPGETVVAQYTITNVLPFPIRVNGVDSQLTYANCVRDIVRDSHATDPGGQFPIYLKPGETSGELTDVGYTMSAGSQCAASSPRWMGNVIGDQTTGVPEASVATAVATTTTTVTETLPRDPRPFYAVAAAAALAVVAGLVLALRGAGRGRRRR